MRAEWAGTVFPCVPGHEIVGRVSAVGAHVAKFSLGDLVGVGGIIDSSQRCEDCDRGLENYCDGMIGTYNGPTADAPGHTLGAHSERIVVHQRYVWRVRHPEAQLAAVAPLLCAGITTYSPLRLWQAGPGKRLKRDGTMTLVGAPATPHPSPAVFNLITKRRQLAGSMIGGIPETQELLDFCAERGIVSDMELIRAD